MQQSMRYQRSVSPQEIGVLPTHTRIWEMKHGRIALHGQFAMPPAISDKDAASGEAMKVFCLYNRLYKMRIVFAPTLERAKAIAIGVGHVRQANFRRIVEMKVDDESLPEIEREALARAIARGVHGCAERGPDGEWIIDEKSGCI